MKKNLLLLLFALLASFPLVAQDGSARATEKEKDGPTIRFNGQGRTYLTQTGIDGDILEADSSTIQGLTDGEFQLDLVINATPNDKSEVQTILRLRNEFGGFFGAGQSVEVRELWARGIIADALRYRVGDMDIVQTPYTLMSFQEDGSVNLPAIFQPQREVIHYEQFYTDQNTRRLQGGKLDFGLDFASFLNDMEASAYIARIRGTDFFTTPTRFVSGGNLDFSTATLNDSLGLQADFGLNLTHTFDDLNSGEANDGIRNTVLTIDFDVALMRKKDMALHLIGEAGRSNVETRADSLTTFEEDDTFLDVGLKFVLPKSGLAVTASFVDVGPGFFSMGAQSKRIDYNASRAFYNRLGTDQRLRQTGLFDITRDRSVYNFRMEDQLMAFDPRYNNTLAYGMATPNRRGLRLGLDYADEEGKFALGAMAALMSEIRGQGTTELRDFTLIRANGHVDFHRFAKWKKKLRATIGAQIESTSRGGEPIEQVDLSSSLFELGVEAELFDRFELLLGGQFFAAEGNEYIPQRGIFTEVADFPGRSIIDDQESLLGAGFRYTFKPGIYLTVQYQQYNSELGKDNPNNYQLNQFFALYTMNF